MTPNEMTKPCFDIDVRRATNSRGKRFMFDSFNYSSAGIFAGQAIALSTLLLGFLLVIPLASAYEASAQQVFSSADAAASALVAAGKAYDMKTLSSILGPDADQVLSSGDSVADK